MAHGSSKQLLSTETGDPVTDKVLFNKAIAVPVYSPTIEDLLLQIIDRLDTLIEIKRVEKDGI